MSEHKGKDVKSVAREDGKTDTYFGGKDKADGPGHGHVISDSHGNIDYARDSGSNSPSIDKK